MNKTLSELIANLPDVVSVSGNATISAPVVESDAEVQPGGVFVARVGLSVDGHDFIPRAIERGAAAIVGERSLTGLSVPYVQVKSAQEAVGYLAAAYHDYPSRKLVVIGVTGTDGKTTTSTLIHSILQVASNNNAGLISTVAAYLGDETVDTGLHVTTPSAPQIQALLARMVANGLAYAVVEMTSHGLAQGRLNGVDIDVAVLTNVTHEHLDYHGSFEAYRAAKGRMFQMLSQSYRKVGWPKISVINGDDPSADYFAAFPADTVLRYCLNEQNFDSDGIPRRAVNIHYRPNGTEFQVNHYFARDDTYTDSSTWPFFTHLVGEFNVYNCLAAIEATRELYIPISAIQEGIARVKAVPGRMERIDEGQGFIALVDFAHTPNALKNALEACRTMLPEGKRLICVFGCAGLRDKDKRRMMSEVSAQLADFSILTAEDPRTESLGDILQTMAEGCIAQGGVEGKTFIRVPDRGEALYRACQMAQAGDLVIACGKGHEQSMAFGTTEYPWDDREAMRAALRGTPLKTLPTARQ
jgi:UDP-N-acetylmuramoyl-L-alanyl-D-glutamate--2,6-diaminopimelate ligase